MKPLAELHQDTLQGVVLSIRVMVEDHIYDGVMRLLSPAQMVVQQGEPHRVEEYSGDFLLFWKAYPRRIGKGSAWKAWRRLSRPPVEVLLAALSVQIQTEQWTKDAGAFIPHPATWLRARRWEDEVKPARNIHEEEE